MSAIRLRLKFRPLCLFTKVCCLWILQSISDLAWLLYAGKTVDSLTCGGINEKLIGGVAALAKL
jgi:hypothetical protein